MHCEWQVKLAIAKTANSCQQLLLIGTERLNALKLYIVISNSPGETI